MFTQMLIACVVAGCGMALALLRLLLLTPRRQCPGYSSLLPRLRKPGSARKAMLGGSKCPQCGCHVDRDGRKIVT